MGTKLEIVFGIESEEGEFELSYGCLCGEQSEANPGAQCVCTERDYVFTTPGCALLLHIRGSTDLWDSGVDLSRRSHGRYRMKLESIFLTGCPGSSCWTAIADVRTSVSLLVTVRLQIVGPPLARCVTWLCCRSRESSGWFSSGLGLC